MFALNLCACLLCYVNLALVSFVILQLEMVRLNYLQNQLASSLTIVSSTPSLYETLSQLTWRCLSHVLLYPCV